MHGSETMAQKDTRDRKDATFEGMIAGPSALVGLAMEYQRETLRFMSMRLSKDAEFLKRLQQCRNVQDAFNVEAEWMKESLHDYSSEAANVLAQTTERVSNGGNGGNLRRVA
jgi:hypothetical protein